MNAQQYERWSQPLREHPQAARALVLANKCLTYLYYVAYPLLIAGLFLANNALWWKALLFPMIGFVAITFLRRGINKPRPYEALGITPIIPKDTKGKSFPSRHTYSAIAIATTFLLWWPPAGIVMLALGACMAVLRVLGGVHYPIDVIAGAALGVLFTLLELLF